MIRMILIAVFANIVAIKLAIGCTWLVALAAVSAALGAVCLAAAVLLELSPRNPR